MRHCEPGPPGVELAGLEGEAVEPEDTRLGLRAGLSSLWLVFGYVTRELA
jgi:hypothetical protein